jgi:hypothetical protein
MDHPRPHLLACEEGDRDQCHPMAAGRANRDAEDVVAWW